MSDKRKNTGEDDDGSVKHPKISHYFRKTPPKQTSNRAAGDDSGDKRDSTDASQNKDEDASSSLRLHQVVDNGTDTHCLKVVEQNGDLFAAPPHSVLVHACNSQGSWGAGIAAVFAKRFPLAFKKHSAYCKSHSSANLPGTAQLIPPQEGAATTQHFIGCLFTSQSFGRKKDPVRIILSHTGPAMADLLVQVKEWNRTAVEDERIKEIWMCQINSGLFKVPWETTRAELERLVVAEGELAQVTVVSPA